MADAMPGLSLDHLIELLDHSGPKGALLAGAIVGLTLALILVGRIKGMWDTIRPAGSAGVDPAATAQFQAQCIAMIAELRQSEEALRRYLSELQRDNRAQEDELDEMRVQLALLRSQRRRLLDLLRRYGEPKGESTT